MVVFEKYSNILKEDQEPQHEVNREKSKDFYIDEHDYNKSRLNHKHKGKHSNCEDKLKKIAKGIKRMAT